MQVLLYEKGRKLLLLATLCSMMDGGVGVSGAEDEVWLDSVSMLLADAWSPEELMRTRLLCQIYALPGTRTAPSICL